MFSVENTTIELWWSNENDVKERIVNVHSVLQTFCWADALIYGMSDVLFFIRYFSRCIWQELCDVVY